jgi:hypothetical protein
MRCLICGRQSLPGAKLCLDCKAARKRAFDATVTQPLLAAAGAARDSTVAPRLLKASQSVPAGARRAAKIALAAQAQSNILIESPPHAGRWPIVVGALCVAVIAVGYLGHWFGGGKSDTFAAVPDERPVAQDGPATPSIVRPSTPGATAVLARADVPVAVKAAAVEPAAAATKEDSVNRPHARPRPEKAPESLPLPDTTPPPVIAVAPPPPPPVVREVPRPDRWQLMTDAIARCPRIDIAGRFFCEQRLRAQYCEGYWGQVPHCASVPYTEHGQ